jgi:NAD(P)-dependent dehydrogenase (short-subunit alcohol dehydrogenase family)
MQRFKGKFALVTGGTSGMGLATARQFITEGGKAIVTGRSTESVTEAARELGPEASAVVSDAGSMRDLLALRNRVEAFTGRLDLVFVNAGFARFSPLATAGEEHFDELFDTLVKGSFFTVQQVLPLMGAGSAVVFNTSVVTEMGIENLSVYSAAKAAVQSLVKTFAAELTAKGIRVNAVSPGYIRTNAFRNAGLSPDEIEGTVEHITPAIPVKRFGDAEEIAQAVLFLASPEASYVHGAELKVDAGYSIIRS